VNWFGPRGRFQAADLRCLLALQSPLLRIQRRRRPASRSCSQCRLEPGRKPRLPWTAAGGFFAVEMCEHNFVREEGRPLVSRDAVGVGAADEFVLAVGQPDKFGLTELADKATAEALRNDVFQFHTPSLYGRGLDIRCPCELLPRFLCARKLRSHPQLPQPPHYRFQKFFNSFSL
jgi:hypothetical protein